MVITIAFGKGGSCKTTTAAALVNYAKSKGKTVLAIDCDPQGNFTFALNGDATAPGLHSVLIDGMAAADAIQTTGQADLIAAGLDLAAPTPAAERQKKAKLRKQLHKILDYWKKCGVIDGWHEEKQGNSIYCIVIDKPTRKKLPGN